MTALAVGIAALSMGTYAFRIAGPSLSGRMRLSADVQRTITIAAVVLLIAVATSTAIADHNAFAGPAKLGGVAIAGVLAWRKAPFVIVVLAAAAATAVLRQFGLS